MSDKAPKTAEKEAEKSPKTAEKNEKVKVKFLRSHPAYGYFVGDMAEISRADFDKYSQNGPFFEEIKAKKDAE